LNSYTKELIDWLIQEHAVLDKIRLTYKLHVNQDIENLGK